MSKLSNVLLMIQILSSGRKYQVKELSNILEVSKRMVYKYKEEIEKSGLYIESIPGPYGGYVMNQCIKQPKILISENDINILNDLINSNLNEDTKKQISILKIKLENIMPAKIQVNKEILKIYNQLNHAIKYDLSVIISFMSKAKEKNVMIKPLELIYDNEWVIKCLYENKEIRYLKLKRIDVIKNI